MVERECGPVASREAYQEAHAPLIAPVLHGSPMERTAITEGDVRSASR